MDLAKPRPASPASRIGKEPQFWLVLAFVCAAYGARLGTLSIRGEESRRALVAREMIETGDWVVPRTQGVPLQSRPPLQNWLIALASLARGQIDAWAIRLPSALAVLATVAIIYAYGRRFMPPLGSAAAGLAFASMAQVIELGRTGETDALFTLLVSGSLLAWHGGRAAGRPAWRVWCASYALAALATLTKGPQAPVYFVGAVAGYLLWTRQWSYAFTLAHAAGAGVFVALLAAWQVPYYLREGAAGVAKIYTGDVGHRFLDAAWWPFVEHLLVYPWELVACLLPWSALLIVYRHRSFRAALGPARDAAAFLAISMAVAFPSVWLPPGSRPRYFMALFPCVAILAGLVVQRLSEVAQDAPWRPMWRLFARGAACAMWGIAAAILAVSWCNVDTWFAQTGWFALLYAGVSGLLAAVLWRAAAGQARANLRGVCAIAAFVALTHAGVMVNAHQGTTVDVPGAVANLKARLPRGTRLVSFNLAHHLFVFHYAEPIPVLPWPESSRISPPAEYFCVDVRELESKSLPFPWQAIAEIPCTRHRVQKHHLRVIVGRALPGEAATAALPRAAR